MEKALKALIAIGLCLVAFSIYHIFLLQPSDKASIADEIISGGLFKLTSLPRNQVARSGEFILKKEDFEQDPALFSLENQKREFTLAQEKSKERGVISFRWGAIETQVFERTLDLILSKLSQMALTKAGRDNKKNTQEFIETVILKNKELSGEEKEDVIRKYVQENLLKLPIEVSLKKPRFEVEWKPDWTPSLGSFDSVHKLVVFDNFYSEWTRNFFKRLPKLSQKFPRVYFGFRPVFNSTDPFQNMLAEIGFCVWANSPEKYFNFIKEAVLVKQKNMEKDLYREVERADVSLPPIKSCLYEREYKDVVQYHQDYAQFLKIQGGPIIFLNGRVYAGGLSFDKLEEKLSFLRSP